MTEDITGWHENINPLTHRMEKGIRMAKDKITHRTHGLKGHYLSGYDNIKDITNRPKNAIPMEKTKQNIGHIGTKNTAQVDLIM